LEIFTIHTIKNTLPLTYILKDSNDEIIKGSFYENELLKTSVDNVYIIEKIIKTKVEKGKKKNFIKWLGFDNSHNSWVDVKDMKI
jgi:hypothetical protein